MLGYPADTVWVRFTWRLSNVAALAPPALPEGYTIRDAGLAEAGVIAEVVVGAYESDPVWAEMMDGIRPRMSGRVRDTIGRSGTAYLAVTRQAPGIAGQIAAASGVGLAHSSGQNLLTGICVLGPHQRRGIGRRLLWQSLVALGELGAAEAVVYTERGSVADICLYPKFGSAREEGVRYPAAVRAAAGEDG
jgi:hypothetical protein